jgi:hypothetical protein
VPEDPALRFRHLPVRFAWFDDGIFIVDAADEKLIGAKVLIAAEKMAPYVSADNEYHRRLNVADYLAIPEMLAAAGLAPAPDRVELVTNRGNVTLEPIPFGAPAGWLDKVDGRPFSFRYLPEERIVHFVFNEVANAADESLADFAARMFRFIAEKPVDALIIDIRKNAGGNGSLNRSLIHELIRSDKLRDTGRVFVLTGRRTYSAAVFLAIDLEQQTNAIFVGEPTGGAPVGYGDSRKTLLTSSGITLRTSTLYWQKTHWLDKRPAIEPHIGVPLTSESLRRDVALEPTLDIVRDVFHDAAEGGGGPLRGTWKGSMTIDHLRPALLMEEGKITSPELGLDRAALTVTAKGVGWTFGVLSMGGRTYPFVLSRKAAATLPHSENYAARLTGRRTTMLVPTPSMLATVTSPPWASTICLTM